MNPIADTAQQSVKYLTEYNDYTECWVSLKNEFNIDKENINFI